MSPKTTAQKLLIKSGTAVWASDAAHIGVVALPEDAGTADSPADADVALVFAADAASLRATLADHDVHATDVVWVVYPKGNRTDINRDSLWPMLAEHGMRPISQVSVDDTWSALRFRSLRPDEPPFTGGR